MNSKQRINSIGKQDYGTPHWLFNTLQASYGFTIDACAGIENAKLPRYWSEDVDGLTQNWGPERVFCNPPFNDVESWVEKSIFETFQNYCQFALMLVNNDCSTRWWDTAYTHSTHRVYINRRVKYIGAPQAQMVSSMCFIFTPVGFMERSSILRISPAKMKEIDHKVDYMFQGMVS